jgi:hypothetical protein
MFILSVACHAQTHNIAFDDQATADAALAALEARLKEEKWDKNRAEEPTHRITSALGDVVVVLDKVELARVVDFAKDHELSEATLDKRAEGETARKIRAARAYREAFPKDDSAALKVD